MIKILNAIDIDPILECYFSLKSKIQWTDFGNKQQAGLQFKDTEDQWDSAVGKSKGYERDYTNLNPIFKDTVFEEIINKYNLSRTRLMVVNPMTCYSMHKDSTPRIHIPMITNSECYFVFKQGIIQHLPLGHVYWTNTVEPHTFMNCSDHHRLHLVGVVES
jgi:hypothetical protein